VYLRLEAMASAISEIPFFFTHQSHATKMQ
jgi:hypothetical protein